jgi:carbamoyl-phosphate synthase large subunit
MPPRILFSSLSAKLALYREVARDARHFHKDAKVIACDSDPNCAASRDVEYFIPLPKISELTDEELIEICKLHKISHVLPTRDGELLFWAQRRELLAQHNIQVWVSNEECIRLCNDKLSFYESWINCPIPAIPTYDALPDNQMSRWVVKPKFGSGGRKNKMNLSYHEAFNIASSFKHESIFQPFVSGREFSAEAWISKEGRCYGPLLRWRNKVVDGESHQSTVFRNLDWEERVRNVFLHRPGLYGHCLAQVLVEKDGALNLVEINPRLGGASPLALRAGLTSISWHLLQETMSPVVIPGYPQFRDGLFLEKKDGVVSFCMI